MFGSFLFDSGLRKHTSIDEFKANVDVRWSFYGTSSYNKNCERASQSKRELWF